MALLTRQTMAPVASVNDVSSSLIDITIDGGNADGSDDGSFDSDGNDGRANNNESNRGGFGFGFVKFGGSTRPDTSSAALHHRGVADGGGSNRHHRGNQQGSDNSIQAFLLQRAAQYDPRGQSAPQRHQQPPMTTPARRSGIHNHMYPMPVVSSDSEDEDPTFRPSLSLQATRSYSFAHSMTESEVLHLDATKTSRKQSLQFYHAPSMDQHEAISEHARSCDNDLVQHPLYAEHTDHAPPNEVTIEQQQKEQIMSSCERVFEDASEAQWERMEIIPEPPVPLDQLEIGDHVYQWRSLLGVPYVFQHHGIVVNIEEEIACDENDDASSGAAPDVSGDAGTNIDNKGDGDVVRNAPISKDESDANRDREQASPTVADNDKETSIESINLRSHVEDAEETSSSNADGTANANVAETQTQSIATTTATKGRYKVTIADFSNLQSQTKQVQEDEQQRQEQMQFDQQQKSLFSMAQPGIIRTITSSDQDKHNHINTWHKVQYEAPFWKRHFLSRAGTSTSKKGDAVGLILARVHFLLTHPTAIPNYHVLYSNCECVAVWCKTGHWSTLQAASLLESTAASQIKSTSTLAAAAAHVQVSVPASGVWGWMGYTTKISLAASNPYVIPALGAYGALTVGIPAIMYNQCHRRWQKTGDALNQAFWQHAMDDPDVFAESLAHWSTLEGPRVGCASVVE